MANRNSPKTPPLQDQVPNKISFGIENTLDPDMPQPELTTSPVAGDDGSDSFSGLLFTSRIKRLWKSGPK